MNPSTLPKGPSIESDGMFGQAKEANQPGIYRHRETGKELTVLPDPTSRAQQDALVRLGFEWVGEAPTRNELLKIQAAQLAADKKNPDPEPGAYVIDTDPNRVVHNGTDDSSTDAALAKANARIAELEATADQTQVEPAAATPEDMETPEEPEEAEEASDAPETPEEPEVQTKTNKKKES